MNRNVFVGLTVGMLSALLLFKSAVAQDKAALSGTTTAASTAQQKLPPVITPPEAFFEMVGQRDRDVARQFYKKYIDVKGMPVVASGEVADEALQRTYDIVTHMLAGRPDIIEQMVRGRMYLIIIGKDQLYTDMPEYRNDPDPVFKNERVRGTGGRPTSFGEENLLNLLIDRYDDESIGVHEFCHTIDSALGRIDPTWGDRMNPGRKDKMYRNAVAKGRWKYAYAGSNSGEYWAEICQSYFDCNRINNWNHAGVATREQLREYDPEGYELVKSVFNLSPENDWRYRQLQPQPSVIAPPAKFKIDPYYTKFTWAREFPVVGSGKVSNEALLKANDTIRKMFAYRHDLLKVLINDGAKLVVLGRDEKLSDLPEFKDARSQVGFDEVRYLDYSPDKKLLVVGEENVLGLPSDPYFGKSAVVSVFARGVHKAAGMREAEASPAQGRGGGRQQYEQQLIWNQRSRPIKRMDIEFDVELRQLFENAASKGLWKGTPAANDRADYWAAGVLAYFDAAGDGFPPNEAADSGVDRRPITTREALKAYDPDLYALVDETMLYTGHQDWRYKR